MLTLNCNIYQNPTVNDFIEANKIIKKIENRDSKLVYSKLGKVDILKLVIHTDVSYTNLPYGAFRAGKFVIILCQKDDKANVLCWLSTKLKHFIKIPTAAEGLALVHGFVEAISIWAIMCDILIIVLKEVLIEPIINNRNLKSIIYSTKVISENDWK